MKHQNIYFEQWSINITSVKNDSLFYNNPYHIAASLVFDDIALSQITANFKINTDNIAYTDYFAFESLTDENLPTNLKFFNDNRNGIDRFFSNISDTVLMKRFVKGNINLTTGLYYMLKGNHQEFDRFLQKACMVNPENEEFHLLINLESVY
jgi:hypothetical protein